jgi:hypothetical protein
MKIRWTFWIPKGRAERHFGKPIDFIRWLQARDFPHTSGDWITDLMAHKNPDGATIYVHKFDGKVEWVLTWAEVLEKD